MVVSIEYKSNLQTHTRDFSQNNWVGESTMFSSYKEITFLSKNWDGWYEEHFYSSNRVNRVAKKGWHFVECNMINHNHDKNKRNCTYRTILYTELDWMLSFNVTEWEKKKRKSKKRHT